MIEIFKDIKGYEGLYQVSNFGRVKSLNYMHTGKEHILKLGKDKDGYLIVKLHKGGKYKNFSIHRLVASTFIENPENLPCVNHRNEIKTDNRVENLEYCTTAYNNSFGTRNRRISEKLTNGKLSKEVLQYSLDGTFIKEFPSTREVERQLGYDNGYISKNCSGKCKSAYGYIWKYK